MHTDEFWGRHGRLARVLDGPIAGGWVLVWLAGGTDHFWLVADRPFNGQSDVARYSRAELEDVAARWRLDWQQLTRSESRREAELFGIRPEMNPASAHVRRRQPVRMEAGGRVIFSPGARWLGVPLYSLWGGGSLAGVFAIGGSITSIELSLAFIVAAALGVPLALRAWFVRLVVEDDAVVIHGWLRRRSLPRSKIAGVSVGEYPLVWVGIPWAFSSGSPGALRPLQVGGGHLILPDMFGFGWQMRRAAGRLEAHLHAGDQSGGIDRAA